MPSEIREREIAEPSAFETFDRLGYVAIPALLEPALVNFFWSYANTKFASQLMTPSSPAVPNSPVSYGDPAFDGLLEHVRPLIEKYSNLRLLPTFSEFRMYKHGDLLKRHRDPLACEISVSVNIGQTPDDSWPLYVEGTAGPHRAVLKPGDGLLYRGVDCFHWREPFEGSKLVQAFLFYVDRDGRSANLKFDGRKSLMVQRRSRLED